jgi:acyl-CoA synthetase (AMP-forming)/AMP-acid ligase II
VVAEKYAAEIAAIRDELPELEHMLVRDLGHEDRLARQFAVDPEPAIDPDDQPPRDVRRRHVSGARADRNTTCCDDGSTRQWFAKDVPGSEQATAERRVDGWMKTGDIGRLDAKGYFSMLDRAGDRVISVGFNICPAELANVIAAQRARWWA